MVIKESFEEKVIRVVETATGQSLLTMERNQIIEGLKPIKRGFRLSVIKRTIKLQLLSLAEKIGKSTELDEIKRIEGELVRKL